MVAMPQQQTAMAKHAEKLFEALKACGSGWHSRGDIARQMGKNRMSSYDAAALEILLATARIEAERHTIEGPIPLRWEYKIKEDEN